MMKKNSLNATFLGFGSSLLSLAGFCGSGLCVAACGALCLAPLATFLGFSTAGLSAWVQQLLPLLTAISAIAFTVSYYSLYKQPAQNCCENGNEPTQTGGLPKVWAKRMFWIGLVLTLGFYGSSYGNYSPMHATPLVSEGPSCSALTHSTSAKACQPSSCSATK